MSECLLSCGTVRPIEYLRIHEGYTYKFYSIFARPIKDTMYAKVETLFGKAFTNDTFNEQVQIVYRHFKLGEDTVFYAISVADSTQDNPLIGKNNFFSSVMLFKENNILLAPVFFKKDLSNLSLAKFADTIPYLVNRNDKLRFKRQKNEVSCTFKRTSIQIGERKFKKSLLIELTERTQDGIFFSQMWVDRNEGILKWVRSTGRIETRIFSTNL